MNANSLIAVGKKYPIPLVCGVASLALFTVHYFRSDVFIEQQAELETLNAKNKKQLANVSNGTRLEEQVDFLKKANDRVLGRALPLDGLAQNLQYFYRLESELGVKYSDLRSGGRSAVPKGAFYAPLNYNISFQSDFALGINFIRGLEQGVYFCRINSATASRGGNGVVFNLNLDLLGIP